MSEFSDNDINEAKRRVWEMRNKAANFVEDNQPKPPPKEEEEKEEPNENERENENEDDKSFLVILALILLLSREKADNTLILALLYLLL